MKYEDAMKIRLWSGDYTRDRQLSIFARSRIYFLIFTSRGVDWICRCSFSVSLHRENGQSLCKISYSVQICDIYGRSIPHIHTYMDTCLFDVHVLLFRAELSTSRGA